MKRKVPRCSSFSFFLVVISGSINAQQDTTPLDPFDNLETIPHHHHQCDIATYSSTQTVEIASDLTLTILQDSGQFLEGTEGDATGTKIWDASLCLANYIHSDVELFDKSNEYGGRDDTTTVIITELGSGVGLPSLTMAQKIRQSSLSTGNDDIIRMIATDREEATLQQLRAVTKLNGLEKYLTVQQLDWNEDDDENLNLLGRVDTILAADVVYHENMVHPLAGIIDRLLTTKSKGGERGIVYVALNNQRRGLKQFVEEAMPKVGFELFQTISCTLHTGNTIYIFRRRRLRRF